MRSPVLGGQAREAAGCIPLLAHAAKAKVMMGNIHKTDKLDAQGLATLLYLGKLPSVWIPPAEVRDERELPRTRMVFSQHRTRVKNRIRLPRAAVRPTGVLVKRGLAVLFEPVDPLISGLAGYAEAFGEFRDGVVIQLIVFEESLSLFAHGNTFPGHGHLLYNGKCYPCP